MKDVLAALAIAAAITQYHSVPRSTYFAGGAGPYRVSVGIELPGVIPGRARIVISTADTQTVHRVEVQPLFWNIPAERAPAPDRADAVSPGSYEAHLWLMVSGSYGVRVVLDGDRGKGVAVIPVSAVAYERLDMPRPLALLLAGLATFLSAGMITIVRAATRESTLPEGEAPDRRARRRSWIGVATGCAVAALVIVGGRAWWGAVDRTHRARLFKPSEFRATTGGDRVSTLHIEMIDSLWRVRRRYWPLVDDQGSRAHVFLVADSDRTVAALEPFHDDSVSFAFRLPPLPVGPYHVYEELTDSTGFTEIPSGVLRVPEGPEPVETPPPGGVVADWHRENGWAFALRGVTPGEFTADLLLLRPGGEMVRVHPWGTMSAAAMRHFTPGWSPPPLVSNEVSFPYPVVAGEMQRAWLRVTAGGKTSIEEFTTALR